MVIVMVSGEKDRPVLGGAFGAGVEFLLYKRVELNKFLKLIRATESSIERERRRFTRVQLRCRVLLDSGNDRLDGTTLDFSLRGALVQSHRAFPSGTPVTVRLELEAGTAHMRSGARVILAVGTDCMGIQFENLGSKESNRLQQFLLPLILAAT